MMLTVRMKFFVHHSVNVKPLRLQLLHSLFNIGRLTKYTSQEYIDYSRVPYGDLQDSD